MKLTLEITEYEPEYGLTTDWEDNFIIKTQVENGILISANKEGLLSLAKQLLTLGHIFIMMIILLWKRIQ